VLIAIAITATMDANGLTTYSALPLIVLFFALWYLQKLSRVSVGFVWGRWRDYRMAVLYPVIVLGIAVSIALVAGATQTATTNWTKAWSTIAIASAATIILALITEEGFFRGWLWASLRQAGRNATAVVLFTSIAFALWHISEVTLAKGYTLPWAQIPVFIVNAAIMGAIWGLMRAISGSVIVASVSHGLWNGGAYVLFGVGSNAGALGVKQLALFGPEVGFVGLVLNAVFAAVLWRWWRASPRSG
jgi:uncharacterized protein